MKITRLWMRLMPLVVLLLFTACRESEELDQKPDCEVTVNLYMDTPSSRLGDPGIASDEMNTYWTKMDLFFVYEEGRVFRQTLTKDEFDASENKRFVFQVPEGTISLYGVAYGDEQQSLNPVTPAEVKSLRTTDITTVSEDKKKVYLLSLFSGKTESKVVSVENVSSFDLTLTRLIAKIDVQWDAQGAYADNAYTDVVMGDMSLTGLAQGYFFPEDVADLDQQNLTDNLATYKMSDPISQRNGRTYFYAFPGVKNHIKFNVNYTSSASSQKSSSYDAVFLNSISKASWHKINLTVRGTKTETSNNIELGTKN